MSKTTKSARRRCCGSLLSCVLVMPLTLPPAPFPVQVKAARAMCDASTELTRVAAVNINQLLSPSKTLEKM